MNEVLYRKPDPKDTGFIYSTWLKNARYQGDRKHMVNRVYFPQETARVKHILERCLITVICNPEDLNHIYGWCAYSFVGDIFLIHYAYIKKPYQKLGLLTELLKTLYPRFKKEQVAITHINEEVWRRVETYNLFYNPYLIERI